MPFLDPDAVDGLLAPRAVVTIEELGGPWAPVHRATLDDGSTVVVKERRRKGTGWGYDPANLRNERAALATLGAVDGWEGPAFLAGDDERGVVVMTDLGRGTVLEELLLDPMAGDVAAAGLVEHGRALARLHAATTTTEARQRFAEQRRALDPDHDPMFDRCRYVIHDLFALFREVDGFARELGFSPPKDLEGDLSTLRRALTDPGPFLALTQLDASPQNSVVLADGTARIVDFEGAGMRHLGLDAAFLRFPFPTYGHWAVLPDEVRTAMEDAYRATLVEGGVAAAADDAEYARMMAVGCAALVVLRIHRLPFIAADDEQAVRRRTQMVSQIDVFRGAADDAGTLRRLASWFGRVGDEMRDRWDEARQAPRAFPALPSRWPGEEDR